MTPQTRKLAVLLHVLVSVGAFGLYAGLLVLAVTGLTTRDPERLRAAYLAMGIVGDSLIVPVNLAVLTTGLLLALGTHWGVFRYYWVVAKLSLSLLLATASIVGLRARIAEAIGNVTATPTTVGSVGTFLILVLPIAVTIYAVNTVLSVYKPWGRIRRRRPDESAAPQPRQQAQEGPTRPAVGWPGH